MQNERVVNMGDKVLFVATVVKTHIRTFHIPYLKLFKDKGWETTVAARNDYENPQDCVIPFCDRYCDIPFERSPFKSGNFKAYKELKKIIDAEDYQIIHCHTPMGAVLTRIAARKARKKGCKVIYTAHGFHFYKGAPLVNWLLYYPMEWLLAHWTDVLITINQEDYTRAQKHLHAKRVVYVPGVGVTLNEKTYTDAERAEKRAELGIPEGAKIALTVGELNLGKNHETVIRAVAQEKQVYLLIAGRGVLQEYLSNLVKELGLSERVKLLGFRNDIGQLDGIADVFLFPSFREGLSVALMEAMAAGLPVVCSDIRGNNDLIQDRLGGFLVHPTDIAAWQEKIKYICQHPDEAARMGQINLQTIQSFELSRVVSKVEQIYQETLNEKGMLPS